MTDGIWIINSLTNLGEKSPEALSSKLLMCMCGREKLLWKIQLLRRKWLQQSPSASAGRSSRLCIARAAPELLLWFLWFVRSRRYLGFALGWVRWSHWSHSLQAPVCSELPEMRKAKLVMCSLPTPVSSLAVPAPPPEFSAQTEHICLPFKVLLARCWHLVHISLREREISTRKD